MFLNSRYFIFFVVKHIIWFIYLLHIIHIVDSSSRYTLISKVWLSLLRNILVENNCIEGTLDIIRKNRALFELRISNQSFSMKFSMMTFAKYYFLKLMIEHRCPSESKDEIIKKSIKHFPMIWRNLKFLWIRIITSPNYHDNEFRVSYITSVSSVDGNERKIDVVVLSNPLISIRCGGRGMKWRQQRNAN